MDQRVPAVGKPPLGDRDRNFYPALSFAAWQTSAFSAPVAGSLLGP